MPAVLPGVAAGQHLNKSDFMIPTTNEIETVVAVGSGAALNLLEIHHGTETTAASVRNDRVDKLINTSIRIRNPCLECVENGRYSISLRLIKALKQ